MSKAMDRVANALAEHCPEPFVIVPHPWQSDIQILHVVGNGLEAVGHKYSDDYVVIQYCHKTAKDEEGHLPTLWDKSQMVFSYLPSVRDSCPEEKMYFNCLGIDESFMGLRHLGGSRGLEFITSGYVHGDGAEAIDEVHTAVNFRSSLSRSVHLGPRPKRSKLVLGESNLEYLHNISDSFLSCVYRTCKFVSGLRYVEGFELPVVEGMSAGCIPVVFDREDMRVWYEPWAVFIPECQGPELVEHLMNVIKDYQGPLSGSEISDVRNKFNWEDICYGFWRKLSQLYV
jgi:glycosyltransferase involved in cell wall biosynthesis